MATVNPNDARDKKTRASIAKVQKEYNIDMQPNQKLLNDPDMRDFSSRILRARDVTLVGGPFHYNIRSATYGDPYDEIPWKVRMGMSETKERHGYPDNPFVCNYGSNVLLNNWVEDRRDRKYLKYTAPRINKYADHYQSETMLAYKKPSCNKQRDVLLKISSFPLTAYPGHQPELNLETLQYSSPKPETCIEDEKIANCEREMQEQKRQYKAKL